MARRMKPGVERVYLGDRVIRVVPQAEAARLVNQGKASVVHRGGVYMGIRLENPREVSEIRFAAVQKDVRSLQEDRQSLEEADVRRSCVVLSRAEAEAIADRARSRTACMTEAQRDSRVLRGLPEMDLPERARAKFSQMFGRLTVA